MSKRQAETVLVRQFLDNYAMTTKGRQRVQQVLDCALEIFATEGFEQVTLRELARRLEMSIGNLQHYFPTREALLEAMLTYLLRQYDMAYVKFDSKNFDSPLDLLSNVARYLILDDRDARTNGIFFELWALANKNPYASDVMTKMYKHHVGKIQELVAKVNPRLAAKEARARAVVIASLIEGLMVFLADRREKFFDEKAVIKLSIDQIVAVASA